MKVVERAFALLDLLRHFEEMPLADIAAALEVSNASAWNLLTCLARLGQVEKTRFGVYRLGLAARGMHPKENSWKMALESELRRLSTTVKESSVAARLVGDRLKIVCDMDYEGELVVRNRIHQREDALYCWACGHILLAHAPDRIVKTIVAAKGLPDQRQWPNVQTPERFHDQLAKIRETGLAERHTPGLPICSIAVHCELPDGIPAALGISYPGAYDSLTHRELIIANLKLTAKRLAASQTDML